MTLKKLYKELENTKHELYELHFVAASPEMYIERRSELEYKIACIEANIQFEKTMKPFWITLVVFTIIAVSMVLISIVN
jgi:hypothetical protein